MGLRPEIGPHPVSVTSRRFLRHQLSSVRLYSYPSGLTSGTTQISALSTLRLISGSLA